MNENLSTALNAMIKMAVDEYKTGKKVSPSAWTAKVKAYREASNTSDFYDGPSGRTFRLRTIDLGALGVARIPVVR